MSQDIDAETEKARAETVEVLLAELRGVLDKQFHAIDGLDSKAGVIFGAASLVAALMTVAHGGFFQKVLATGMVSCYVQAGLAVAVLLYVGIIYSVVRAIRVVTYYLPLRINREEIHEIYLPLPQTEAKEQILANYIEVSQENLAIIRSKARWVQVSLYLLAADVVYLTILIAVGTVTL